MVLIYFNARGNNIDKLKEINLKDKIEVFYIIQTSLNQFNKIYTDLKVIDIKKGNWKDAFIKKKEKPVKEKERSDNEINFDDEQVEYFENKNENVKEPETEEEYNQWFENETVKNQNYKLKI